MSPQVSVDQSASSLHDVAQSQRGAVYAQVTKWLGVSPELLLGEEPAREERAPGGTQHGHAKENRSKQ